MNRGDGKVKQRSGLAAWEQRYYGEVIFAAIGGAVGVKRLDGGGSVMIGRDEVARVGARLMVGDRMTFSLVHDDGRWRGVDLLLWGYAGSLINTP
jgi:hypothetical protein